ncbi:MAG: hypothetical protein AAF938_05495 [Myxococcota bacterium]
MRCASAIALLVFLGCGDDDSADARLDLRVRDDGAVDTAVEDMAAREDVGPDGSMDGGVDQRSADDAVEVGEDADMLDMARDSALLRENPDVELVREITFEQPDGTNGWGDAASLLFNWRFASTGRDRVPDAMLRMATGINVPSVVSDVTYRGEGAAMLVMEDWGQDTFRQDIEMVGDLDSGVDRRFRQGETHVVGFAMRIEHATYAGGGFQLYHQYHNSNPAKAGYGITNNPAVSLLRASNDDLTVAIRDNRPGGERLNTFERIEGGVRAGQWVRWVWKTRFANFDSGDNGLLEVWSAVGDEPLQMHFRVDDRPIGYVYENPADGYETINFDCYGTPMQADAAVYVDEVRIVDGDVDPSTVDPINWVGYQHPLNQPHDEDLR